MAELQDLLHIMRIYSRKRNSPEISFKELYKYTVAWSVEIRKNRPEFSDFSEMNHENLRTLLDQAVEEGVCETEGSRHEKIVLIDFFVHNINKFYEMAEADFERPFPSGESMGIHLQNDFYEPVNIKEDFINYIRNENIRDSKILRLMFPAGIRDMMITTDLINTKLLALVVLKLRFYLSVGKNSDYLYHRMLGLFPAKEKMLRDLFTNIKNQKDVAVSTLKDPDEFTFKFWSTFSSQILKDLEEKKEKLDREHTFCQAAYILSYYNMHLKGKKQQLREKETALKTLDNEIHKAPYCFTFNDIVSFRDKGGTPISSRLEQSDIVKYLEAITSRPIDGESVLPELLRIRTPEAEYYILKDRFLPLVLRKINETGRELRKEYVREWNRLLEDFTKTPSMQKDDVFIAEVKNKIEKEYPFLHSMLKYELFYLCLKETRQTREVEAETTRLFKPNETSLMPYDQIFRLDRKEIVYDAKTRLPLWKSIPVLASLGILFKKYFSGRRKGFGNRFVQEKKYKLVQKNEPYAPRGKQRGFFDTLKKDNNIDTTRQRSHTKDKEHIWESESSGSGAGVDKNQKEANLRKFRKAVQELKAHYLGDAGNIDEELNTFFEQWNILVDNKAKQDYHEDVNSAVRDYMRKIKRTFAVSVPEAGRIRNLAEQFSQADTFDKIRDKEAFIRYVELYIIKQLSKR